MNADPIRNAFTVDVEDYFHVSAFADRIHPRSWEDYPSRVVGNTCRILEMLQRHQVRATFFVLGWVARRHPDLVRQIQRQGHEIASHGYWHRLIYTQSPDEFRLDLRQSRDVLEQLTGTRVMSYRAPSFSIVKKSIWAIEILSEEGYQFDSSIFPVRHDRYGIPASERFPFGIESSSGTLWEFPPPVIQRWGMRIPVGGGDIFACFRSGSRFRDCERSIRNLDSRLSFIFIPGSLIRNNRGYMDPCARDSDTMST